MQEDRLNRGPKSRLNKVVAKKDQFQVIAMAEQIIHHRKMRFSFTFPSYRNAPIKLPNYMYIIYLIDKAVDRAAGVPLNRIIPLNIYIY